MLNYYKATQDKIKIMTDIYMDAFSRSDDFLSANKGFSDYLKAFIEDDDKFARIISNDEEEIGILLAMETPSIIYGKQIHIDTLGVVTKEQNKGHGHILIEYFRKEMIERGYHCLTLNTRKNSLAHQLYKKVGFKEELHSIRMYQMISSTAKRDIEKIEQEATKKIVDDLLCHIDQYKEEGLDDVLAFEKVKDYLNQKIK